MMPICGFRILKFWRCKRVAEVNIGEIATGDATPLGKVWKQQHYLCYRHYIKFLRLLGLR